MIGIETSCDDTAIGFFKDDEYFGHVCHVQSHVRHGGIVPELAARLHSDTIIPALKTLFQQHNLSLQAITGIAYTAYPGLIGSLRIGAICATTLAQGLSLTAIPVHHLRAHALVAFFPNQPIFPFCALIVSGGHTQLVLAHTMHHWNILGATRDNAVGEMLDKLAKAMHYSGAAALSEIAKKGIPNLTLLPKPFAGDALNFSYSGFKTAAMRCIERSETDHPTLAATIEYLVMQDLIAKTKQAIYLTGVQQVVVCGGVACNHVLRNMAKFMTEQSKVTLHIPEPRWCTDNGMMIAYAAHHGSALPVSPSYHVHAYASSKKNITPWLLHRQPLF
jgi:N6-L-threonylcarbamoyladenine synthase